jgi:transcriptional regulator with XRE-family HTH domain
MVALGMELLGRWIRESRVQAGMTQAQLARLAGVHQTTLSRLERGALEGLSGCRRRRPLRATSGYSAIRSGWRR